MCAAVSAIVLFGLAVSLVLVGLAASPSTWTRLTRVKLDGLATPFLRATAFSVIVLLGLVVSPFALLLLGLSVSPLTRTRLNRAGVIDSGVIGVFFLSVVS